MPCLSPKNPILNHFAENWRLFAMQSGNPLLIKRCFFPPFWLFSTFQRNSTNDWLFKFLKKPTLKTLKKLALSQNKIRQPCPTITNRRNVFSRLFFLFSPPFFKALMKLWQWHTGLLTILSRQYSCIFVQFLACEVANDSWSAAPPPKPPSWLKRQRYFFSMISDEAAKMELKDGQKYF